MTSLVFSELKELSEISDMIYVRMEPEVPDFTINQSFKLIVYGKRTVEIEINPSIVQQIATLLDNTIFNKENKLSVLIWNAKPLFSYMNHYLVKNKFVTNVIIYDLFVIESFLCIKEKTPLSLKESLIRFKNFINIKSWKSIYQKIHLPLIVHTIPNLENTPLLHELDKVAKYAYYEIEGQKNGRLRSYGKFSRSYLPHTLGEEQKKILKPKERQQIFMLADINNCEVTFLQILSGDKKLKQFLESGLDVYKQIYETITGDNCDSDKKRSYCKLIFLPVVYGCGSQTLSENLKIHESIAKDLIKRVYHYFPNALEWITEKSKEAKNKNYLEDYFGRKRIFDESNFYTSRNFVVQGPAATVCLEKLIEIDKKIQEYNFVKLAFTVHDSYGILCYPNQAKELYYSIKNIVNSESKLIPNLHLDLHAQFGPKLNNLKTFYK